MSPDALRKRLAAANADLLPANPEQRALIYIDSAQQQLLLFNPDNTLAMNCAVSTSRHGPGQQVGSYQTPTGIHRIAQKIGEGESFGRVFRGRVPVDELCLPEHYDGEGDFITTRIVWLDGLEPGHNRGGDVDSHDRYIYVHGTPDEAHIGAPASMGCVRLRNADVIEFFDRVRVDDLVIID